MNTTLPSLRVRQVPFLSPGAPLAVYRDVRPVGEPPMLFCDSPESLEAALAELAHLDWRIDPHPGDPLRWAYPCALVRAHEAGARLSSFGGALVEGAHPDLDPMPHNWVPRAMGPAIAAFYGLGDRRVSMVWRWEFVDRARCLWAVVPTDDGANIFQAREIVGEAPSILGAMQKATRLGATYD